MCVRLRGMLKEKRSKIKAHPGKAAHVKANEHKNSDKISGYYTTVLQVSINWISAIDRGGM